jgi:hypothetical protein
MIPVIHFRVEATRHEDGWMVCVPAFDLVAHADSWGEVESVAREVIAGEMEMAADAVAVKVYTE